MNFKRILATAMLGLATTAGVATFASAPASAHTSYSQVNDVSVSVVAPANINLRRGAGSLNGKVSFVGYHTHNYAGGVAKVYRVTSRGNFLVTSFGVNSVDGSFGGSFVPTGVSGRYIVKVFVGGHTALSRDFITTTCFI